LLTSKTEGADRVTGLSLGADKASHECRLNGEQIRLTPTEFSILWLLCKNRGRVYSADELFRMIWGEKYFKNSRNTVMVQIRHIREKLNDIGDKPKFIKTIWGVGYIVEA